MGGKKITLEQEEKVVLLYRTHKYAIKEIMSKTGVRSEQTIYRILSNYDIPMMRREKSASKISVNLDEETELILKKINPRNVSEFVCEMIKKGSQQ